jgi:hypothetical protein
MSSYGMLIALHYAAAAAVLHTMAYTITHCYVIQAEILTVLMFEVLGTTMFAWLIGNVVSLVLNLDPAERNRKQMMGYLNEYIRYV